MTACIISELWLLESTTSGIGQTDKVEVLLMDKLGIEPRTYGFAFVLLS